VVFNHFECVISFADVGKDTRYFYLIILKFPIQFLNFKAYGALVPNKYKEAKAMVLKYECD